MSTGEIGYDALGEFFQQVGAEFGIDPTMVMAYSDCVTVVFSVTNEEKLIRWTPSGWTIETVEEE